MTLPISKSLGLLAGEFGVSLAGLDDDALNLVAIRFLMADTTSAEMFAEIVEDVRRAEGTNDGGRLQSVKTADESPVPSAPSADSAGGDEPGAVSTTGNSAPPAPPFQKLHYNATEATEAKMRARLAKAHGAENKRTGLYLVPRRPTLNPWAIHPACKAAAADGATPCARCLPLTHPGGCVCDPCVEFWEQVD